MVSLCVPALASQHGRPGSRSDFLTSRDLPTATASKRRCKHKHRHRKRCKRHAVAAPPVVAAPQVAAGQPQTVSIGSDPPLFPDFDLAVSDYMVRCTGDPVTVSGEGTGRTSVMVDGHGPFKGDFSQEVPLAPGQAFTVSTSTHGQTTDHFVRCLPPDFPELNFDRLGVPNQQFYVIGLRRVPTGASTYIVVFDNHGVPVWWYPAAIGLGDAKVLSDGSIASSRGNLTGYDVRALDGTVTHTISFQGSPTNDHDMEELPNGDFLVISYKTRADPVDLTPIGGSPDQTVQDAAIQEVDAANNVVWEWNSKDHIGLDQITPRWRNQVATSTQHDLVHLNSVEPDGTSLILSMRFTDAVYSINRATGAIEWKLGGTTIPESLTPVGDDYPSLPLAGQHDARILGDGTLTVHDNATMANRPPRAVRYAIDETARTATQLESIQDPDVENAGCCGSARRSPQGSWLVSWGQRSQITEFAPNGDRAFLLTLGPDILTAPFSYRAFPVPPGLLHASDLRAGMSSMFPR